MNTFEQTVDEVGTMLGHKLFHDLMGGGFGQIPVDKEAVVIALVYDLEAELVAQDLTRIQEATKVHLFHLQAENIRKHAEGNETKAKMVKTIQTRADVAAVKAAREALATFGGEMTEAAKDGIRKVADRKIGDFCR